MLDISLKISCPHWKYKFHCTCKIISFFNRFIFWIMYIFLQFSLLCWTFTHMVFTKDHMLLHLSFDFVLFTLSQFVSFSISLLQNIVILYMIFLPSYHQRNWNHSVSSFYFILVSSTTIRSIIYLFFQVFLFWSFKNPQTFAVCAEIFSFNLIFFPLFALSLSPSHSKFISASSCFFKFRKDLPFFFSSVNTSANLFCF